MSALLGYVGGLYILCYFEKKYLVVSGFEFGNFELILIG